MIRQGLRRKQLDQNQRRCSRRCLQHTRGAGLFAPGRRKLYHQETEGARAVLRPLAVATPENTSARVTAQVEVRSLLSVVAGEAVWR